MPQIPLTQYDIIFAFAGAALLFVFYRAIRTIVRIFVTRTSEIQFNPDQLANVLENCYRTFPIDFFSFKGATYRRGTPVRITTNRQTTIEGQFIGTNQAEMLCVMTNNSVIAQEIGTISEITPL